MILCFSDKSFNRKIIFLRAYNFYIYLFLFIYI